MSDVHEDAPPVESDSEYDKAFEEFEAARTGAEPADEPEDPSEPKADDDPAEGKADEPEAKADPEPDPEPAPKPDPLAAIGLDPDRAAHEIRSNRERISALQHKINEQQAELTRRHKAQAPVDEDAPEGISDKDWADLRNDMPELATAIESRFANMQRQLDNALGQATEPIRRFEDQRRHEAFQSAEAAVEAAHPGWKNTVNTPEFRSWLVAQPSEVQQMTRSDDANSASYLLDLYERANGTAAQKDEPAGDPPADVSAIKEQRERRLRDATGIAGRSGQAGQSGPPDDFEAAFEYFERKRARG